MVAARGRRREGEPDAMGRLIKRASARARYRGLGRAEAVGRGSREGNFPPRKPLRENETRKETPSGAP
jgi:hypothetical protein